MDRKESIGILGVQSGVGVTHLGVAMMEYSLRYRRSRTAYVELSGNHEIEQLQEVAGRKFHYAGRASFFPNQSGNSPGEWMQTECDTYIVDAGSDFYRSKNEFMRCDRKLVLMSLSPWKNQEVEQFMTYIYKGEKWGNSVTLFAHLGNKKDKKDFQKKYKIPIFCCPYIEDPFHLKKTDVNFLRTLF
ncbi:MAG: hypothetical protein ACI4DO_04200 [Roseburia sp.]